MWKEGFYVPYEDHSHVGHKRKNGLFNGVGIIVSPKGPVCVTNLYFPEALPNSRNLKIDAKWNAWKGVRLKLH